jgi:hypothetical protein
MPVKIAVGMIVFEGDYVLKQCLDQVYPHVDQILIAEGPVAFWQAKGKRTSEDRTNEILDTYPDPDGKLKVVHGMYSEKDDQSNAYMVNIADDIDYLWMIDSDEVYRTEDILKIKALLESERPTSVGMRSCSFYGGFNHYLTGFELKTDNFLRIFRYVKGAKWLCHRPPTMQYPANITRKHISSDQLFNRTGVQMYHYSYTFPDQVYKKTNYYMTFVPGGTIENYFGTVYYPWVLGDDSVKRSVEQKHQGVHEWVPQRRGPCFTEKFRLQHPEAIQRDMLSLHNTFNEQLSKYVKR